LRRETFSFSDITEDEVLVEPIYGCWEGNMSHAIERRPIDICRDRGEEKVIIGNAGVVRVLKTGSAVSNVKEGDLCLVFCNGIWDKFGYPKKILAYDAPNTIGLLSKRTKLHQRQVIPIPANTRHSIMQWAGFTLRYITAWANWKAAYRCFRSLLTEEDYPHPYVCGWGGGVTLAELSLAKHFGCQAAMMASDERRLKLIESLGIDPIDRRQFGDLNYNEQKYKTDAGYKQAYLGAERAFVNTLNEKTRGEGVSIFVDFIGLPVFRATQKTLARPGIVTTAGWKEGMNLSTVRAIDCINWHTHVHTHYARYSEGIEAVDFAEEHGWMPPAEDAFYEWDEIPQLARDYARGSVVSYFPTFRVNPL
jgi:NADPH:quinone reductase-like Zn-dependent oxidoreductase